jgi:type II restriction enzyme
MKELSALEIMNKLVDEGILKQNYARIFIDFLKVKSEILSKDSIGSIIQVWLEEWFKKEKIFYKTMDNSQERPDFILSKKENEGFVEIKAFCSSGSPSFDIQSWNAFLNLMLKNPNHIHSDYLIFEYEIYNKKFKIKNLFLKKIWEMSRPMSRAKINWPINVQYKNNEITNLRPRGNLNEEKFFNNEEEFLNAIQQTIEMYDKAEKNYKNGKWLENVKARYRSINNKNLF